jgi:hypothetical protein
VTNGISPKNRYKIKLIFRNRINHFGNLKYLVMI